MHQERVVGPREQTTDNALDQTLRPSSLEEYVGQQKIKDNLSVFMQAARKRGEPIEHVLLYGPPGLGKTTLAHIIAGEMDADLKVTSGPALERAGDLAAVLSNLQPGDILFIDEIHRLNRTVEEIMYPAMEDYCLDIVIGKGPSARTLKLDLPRFAIIGATTKMSLLSSPLRDRFGCTYRLDFYGDQEIGQIIARSAGILGVDIDDAATELLSTRSRYTPRIANRLLKRVRDYAQVKADGTITEKVASRALGMLEIDHKGLDQADRRILAAIIQKFGGGPVGLGTIAAATAEEVQTVEEVYEPFLLRQGLIARTPRGRIATDHAYEHLGMAPPSRTRQDTSSQASLLDAS